MNKIVKIKCDLKSAICGWYLYTCVIGWIAVSMASNHLELPRHQQKNYKHF